MVNQEFQKLLEAIRSGALTPGQMEDVVYAMHAAYMDHNEAINEQLSTSLEDFADSMVLARKNTERFEWEEQASPLRSGHVHSVGVEAFV